MPRSAASDLGLHCLPMSQKWDARLIWVIMVNALSPEYLSSLVPPTVGSLTPYPLRNATNIQTIHSASQLYYNSFLQSFIRDWTNSPRKYATQILSIPLNAS